MAGPTYEVTVNQGISFTSSGVYDVKLYGAIGDGATDDTDAIQSAVDTCYAAGGGIVFIPPGTYNITTNLFGSGGVEIKSNITVQGAGNSSIIKCVETSTQCWGMFYTVGAEHVRIERIKFDGNQANVYDNEQMHGIHFRSSSDMAVLDCTFYDTRGDGIVVYSVVSPNETYGITVDRCYFDTAGRNQITLGSGYSDVRIMNSHFTGTIYGSHIDCEATLSVDRTSSVLVENNIFDGDDSWALGGYKGGLITFHSTESDNNISYTFRKNRAIEMSLWTRYGHNVTIDDNYFYKSVDGDDELTKSILNIVGNTGHVNVNNNTLVNISAGNEPAIVVRSVSTEVPDGVLITGNHITSNHGLRTRNCLNVTARNNDFVSIDAVADLACVTMEATATVDSENIFINDNMISGYKRGVSLIRSAQAVNNCGVSCNTFNDCADYGIFSANGHMAYFTNFECSSNNFIGTGPTTPFAWSTGAYYKEVSASGVMPEVIVCQATPEGAFTAPVGSRAFNINGGAGTTMYVKESGTGNTGWAAV